MRAAPLHSYSRHVVKLWSSCLTAAPRWRTETDLRFGFEYMYFVTRAQPLDGVQRSGWEWWEYLRTRVETLRNRHICDMIASLRWLSGLGVGRGRRPLGLADTPVTAVRGSNRRSGDDSAASPREAERGDLGRLLPLRQGGRWQSGWLRVRAATGSDGWIVKAAVACKNGLGVSQRQRVWQVRETLKPGSDFNSKQKERAAEGACHVSLATFSPVLNLL